MTSSNVWRSTSERAELVEQLIAITAENQALWRIIRDFADDTTPAALLVAKQAEIEILQRNLRMLLAERPRRSRRNGRAA